MERDDTMSRTNGNEDALVRVETVQGTGCVVRGDDVDTDQIIPARFMKAVTFDDMGRHAFEDARLAAKGDHPLDDERFHGASLLITGQNFGCGSSREHAPQALMRFGFNAFIGGSFAEIFAGNCTSLGLPCVTLSGGDLIKLMDSVELDPTQEVSIDLRARTITSRAGKMAAVVPEGVRQQFLEGTWNATRVLLDAGDAIEQTAAALAYMQPPA
jgi:3-isopropylmalate/(R)-2-methylmalate dehydratase small subunit